MVSTIKTAVVSIIQLYFWNQVHFILIILIFLFGILFIQAIVLFCYYSIYRSKQIVFFMSLLLLYS